MVKIAFSFHKEYIDNPKEMLCRMNSALREKCERHFVTAGYAFIDFTASKLVYSSAGHLPLLVWKKTEKRIIRLKPKGKVLGLFNDVEFANATLDLSAGDRIFLITDGVIECRNPDNVLFGEERFDEAIRKYERLDPNSFIEAVLKDIGVWMNSNDFEDDIAIIVVDC
jgi:sigma-B regulation protein RsbU (phosphoserine phosphatase)